MKTGTRGTGAAQVIWTSYEPLTAEANNLLNQLARVRRNLVANVYVTDDEHYKKMLQEDHLEEKLWNEGVETNHFECQCASWCRPNVWVTKYGQVLRVVEG